MTLELTQLLKIYYFQGHVVMIKAGNIEIDPRSEYMFCSV